MERNKLRNFIRQTLSEAVVTYPDNQDQPQFDMSDENGKDSSNDGIDEGMGRSINMGLGVNLKPNNYPENLHRDDQG